MKCLLLAASLLASACAVADAGWEMFDRRVGMFVHWGVYASLGYHEQARMRLFIPREVYAKRALPDFTADKFRGDDLVDVAESLGAEYIVITTKHHDGFCLWDTKATDFNSVNSPAKRDLIKEVAEACHRRGMKLGFYYSNPDWHHPNAFNVRSSHQTPPATGDVPDMAKYKAFVRQQITELLSNYGEICCLFWDIPTHVEAPEMNELVRRLQPGIRINDRGWGSSGDYSTPERDLPAGQAFRRPTEACDSVGARSWGYRANEDYRTVGYCTRAIDHFLSLGGNFLLNVGPKADGTVPPEARALLKRTGDWYRRVREAYRDVKTVETNVKADDPVVMTRRGNTVYVHCPKGLSQTGLDLRAIRILPQKAVVLNDGAPVTSDLDVIPHNYVTCRKTLHLGNIDADRYANETVVIRLDFAEDPFEAAGVDPVVVGDALYDARQNPLRNLDAWRRTVDAAKGPVICTTPAPRGLAKDSEARRASQAVAEEVFKLADNARILYRDVRPHFLKADGGLRTELYEADGLSLNALGRARLEELVHPLRSWIAAGSTNPPPATKFGYKEANRSRIHFRRGEKDNGARWWWERVMRNLDRRDALCRENGGRLDLLLIGDSISHRWEYDDSGAPVYERLCRGRQVMNMANGGDGRRSQRWLVDNGMIDGLQAKVVSICLGANDHNYRWADDSPAAVARDIGELIALVRGKMPEAKILLMPINPRLAGTEDQAKMWENDVKTNALLKELADGERVVYFDISEPMRAAIGGDLELRKSLTTDFVHLSRKMFERWYELLEPHLPKAER